MNEQDYLMHYGVKGMHWGVRRYQNPDGTRTALGRQHEAELKGSSGSSIRERARSTASKVKSALTSDTAKKVYAGVAVAATVAGAAYLYSRNKGAVDSAIRSFQSTSLAKISKSRATINKGKAYMNKAMNAAKGAASKAGAAVGNAAKKAKQSVGMNAAATADIARNKAKNVGSAIKNSQAVRSAYGAATKAGSAVKGAASKASQTAQAGRTYANNAGRAIKDTASKVGPAAKSAASKASVSARAAVDNARTNLSNMNTRRAMDNAARAQGSVGSYNARKAAFDNGVKSAINTTKNTASKLGSTAKSTASKLGSTASKAGKAVSSEVKRTAYNIKNAGRGVSQVSKNAVEKDRRKQQARKVINRYRSMNK